MNFSGKKVLVVGLGKSGLSSAKYLIRKGAHVSVTDARPRVELRQFARHLPKRITLEAGSHHFFNKQFDLIVTSPGVPYDLPQLAAARRKGVAVWNELELAWREVNPYKTIAVTGTNGKTTTTALIGHILKTANKPVVVGGNIGIPLSALIKKVNTKTYLVLELSSYQLEAQQSFHPDVGIILNVTPDHLARHKTMKKYAQMKARIYANCGPADTAVLNKKDAWCRKIGKTLNPLKSWFPSKEALQIAKSIRLPGDHNLENAMAAALASLAVGINKETIGKALKTFPGVPHRIELIREFRGVRYINDSKGTNIDSTLVALKAARRPTLLILGGQHKGSPYKPLIPLVKKIVKEVITIGEAAPLVQKDLRGAVKITSCGDMKTAVKYSSSVAQKGDDVLLSPACASFDQYRNFEERGRHFATLVKRLK